MTDIEKRIVTAYLGQPDQEDCYSDAVPADALSAEGKKKIVMPQVMSMTKYLFSNYRLMMYSYMNRSLRTGVLRQLTGYHILNRVLNKESCCFPYVSFWRIDRTAFWADVTVSLKLDTTTGQVDWDGILSLWCSFGDSFSCTVEDLTECVDRRAEGYDMLSPFLIPYYTSKRVDEVTEEMWHQFRKDAVAIPAYRDPVKLAAWMGLKLQYCPLFNHKGIGGIIFFSDGEIQLREEGHDCEGDRPRTVRVAANTIVINTNCVRYDYSAFNIFHECFHYEFHYLFYRLQDMYNTDLRKIKTVEVEIEPGKELSDPIFFMEKQANRGAYGLLLPASTTQELIAAACERAACYRHAGEKYEIAGKIIAKDLSLPHFRVRARMIQLGHVAAKGALNYVEKKLIQPFAFDIEAWREEQHTFVIERDTVTALMRESEDFNSVMRCGSYTYADGHVVRDDPRFVKTKNDRLILTEWAYAHVDECCLRFVRVYVQQDLGKYVFGRMYYDADYVKQTQFYLDDLINKEHMDELEAKYKYCREFPTSFREAFDQIRTRNGISLNKLAEELNIDDRTLSRWLDDPTRYRNEDFLTMIALIFKLPDWLSRLLFKRAHVQLDEDDRRHQALEHILRVQSADGIEKANAFLMSNHLQPLCL